MSEIKIPFLYDHHSHFSLYAGLFGSLCLEGEKNKDNALNLLNNLPHDRLNTVYGWNSGWYRFDSSELDALPPVIISNISLHGFVMNNAAEKLLSEQYPEIIANYHNSKWCEDHVTELILFFSKIMPLTVETAKNYLDFLLKTHGIYEIDDMLLPSQEVFDLISNSELKDRVHFWADIETFRKLPLNTQKTIRGIKLFTDGANGASTAALSVPYRNGNTGLLTHSDDELIELLEESSETANAVAIHALGDLATEQTVKAVENIKKRGLNLNVRIEHAQFISEKCAKKAKDLGIILSLQPNFNEDSVIYADRIPEKFLKLNNNFRMLIDKAGFIPGTDMIFGSDGMPHGVQFALEQSLWPAFESQKLTIEEFIKGYCTSSDHGTMTLFADSGTKTVKIFSETGKKCDGPKNPRITCTKFSPFIASDIPELLDCECRKLPVKPVFSLCRCGQSKKMPYCDGTHTEKGLKMFKCPDRAPDRNKNYYGKDIIVHFNLGVCSHDGSCLKLKPVFDRHRRPWILPDLGNRDEIIETIKKCPSGALSYTIDGVRHQDLDRQPVIKVAKGGPLMIEGYIEFKDDENSCPESKEHYCLCRCGGSKNHPFCDGTHLNNGFWQAGK